jgi:hypothetical protein
VKLILLGGLICVGLFVLGLVAPRKSRRAQEKLDRTLKRGERKSDAKAGRVGDWTSKSLETVRKAGDKSAEAGRKSRRAVTK